MHIMSVCLSPSLTFRLCLCISVAESECRRTRVCLCEYFAGGSADSDDPELPAERRSKKVRPASSGQQPGGQRGGNWSAQVRQNYYTIYTKVKLM